MIFEVILATLSTLSLSSLGLYIYFFSTKKNIIHQAFSERGWKDLLPFYHKILAVFAVIGLFIAMFTVANACLYWMPSDWGSVDEDGEYTTLKVSISSIFSLFASGGLLNILESYEEHIRKKKYFWIIDEGYKALLDGLEGNKSFEFLKNDYEEKLDKAEEYFQDISSESTFSTEHLYQEFWEIKAYNTILDEINKFSKK